MDPSDKLRLMAEVQQVLETMGDPEDAWTPESIKGQWGYDARLARKVFGEYPDLGLLFVSCERFWDRGLRPLDDYEWSGVGYYHKSKNGHSTKCRTRSYGSPERGEPLPFVYVRLESP